ncbi:hypothetical protein BAE44_0004544, partial [Dichanthelium oligosanthes]
LISGEERLQQNRRCRESSIFQDLPEIGCECIVM